MLAYVSLGLFFLLMAGGYSYFHLYYYHLYCSKMPHGLLLLCLTLAFCWLMSATFSFIAAVDIPSRKHTHFFFLCHFLFLFHRWCRQYGWSGYNWTTSYEAVPHPQIIFSSFGWVGSVEHLLILCISVFNQSSIFSSRSLQQKDMVSRYIFWISTNFNWTSRNPYQQFLWYFVKYCLVRHLAWVKDGKSEILTFVDIISSFLAFFFITKTSFSISNNYCHT